MPASAAQPSEKPPARPKWEYKALRLESSQCVNENQIATALNTAGQDGWELVGYERLAGFPNEANGTLLIRPAATGQGRDHSPQTADSFQGTMTMKMLPAQPGRPGCTVVVEVPAGGLVSRPARSAVSSGV